MKKMITITLLFILSLSLTGCKTTLDRPEDTNLEFWVTDSMDSWNIEGYTPRYGIMGGAEFYGTGYIPLVDENNQQRDPEYYVIYTITSYPDYSSTGNAITGISITDPNVYVYGLTIKSSEAEIKTRMLTEGFDNPEGLVFTKNKVTFRFSEEHISIRAEVTNRYGIIF